MAQVEYRATVTVSRRGDPARSFRGVCALGGTPRAHSELARRARDYLRAHSPPLAVPAPAPRLAAPARLAALPLVEAALRASGAAYRALKERSELAARSLALGERGLARGAALAAPVARLAEPAVLLADRLTCASLDALERRLPSVRLPPADVYSETRSFVLRRADSVKRLGSAVLDSRVTAATAHALDRALCAADQYVDRYLPADRRDEDAAAPAAEPGGRARAAAAVQHGARLRRKLTRRLTRQALAEAKAIRDQIHVLVYVAELVATDPALAWRKAKELYAALSLPEPENQARPATLEELGVLLTREAARSVVHLLNYTQSDLPRGVRRGLRALSARLAAAADALVRAAPVQAALGEARGLRERVERLLRALRAFSDSYLERLAMLVAGNEEREKLPPRARGDHGGARRARGSTESTGTTGEHGEHGGARRARGPRGSTESTGTTGEPS